MKTLPALVPRQAQALATRERVSCTHDHVRGTLRRLDSPSEGGCNSVRFLIKQCLQVAPRSLQIWQMLASGFIWLVDRVVREVVLIHSCKHLCRIL